MSEIDEAKVNDIVRHMKNQVIGASNDAFESAAKMVEIFGDLHKGEAMEAKRFTNTIAAKLRTMKHDLL